MFIPNIRVNTFICDISDWLQVTIGCERILEGKREKKGTEVGSTAGGRSKTTRNEWDGGKDPRV